MKTFLSLSGGSVELRTRAPFRCVDCGNEYQPRVHAYPGLVIGLGLAAILVVVAAGGMWFAGWLERSWLLWAKVAAAIAVAAIGVMASRLQKRLMAPRIYSRESGREPAFGEIVLGCPRCGSDALPRARSRAIDRPPLST